MIDKQSIWMTFFSYFNLVMEKGWFTYKADQHVDPCTYQGEPGIPVYCVYIYIKEFLLVVMVYQKSCSSYFLAEVHEFYW